MNVVFISPNFPSAYWNFCDRLKRRGANVLGIGDAPYDMLTDSQKASLTEYYKVGSLSDYGEVFRAAAFFSFKYGKIDWIESMNEYWLENDARLRTDFNVCTGLKEDRIAFIKEKALMKKIYIENGIPTARQFILSSYREGTLVNPDGTAQDGSLLSVRPMSEVKEFTRDVGYPVIVKPNIGVGATNTWKLECDADLERFYEGMPSVPYVCEEFIEGDICSYDGITDSKCDMLFESMTVWPPSVMDIVLKDLDLMYYTCPDVPEKLRVLGRKTVKAFDVKSRFVHLEFFRLTKPRKGLGEIGDFVALEVNMRPAGGFTPDMMDYAHSLDVYSIWADMVVSDRRELDGRLYTASELDEALLRRAGTDCFCVYASRKDGHAYMYPHEEIMSRYGSRMVMQGEMPEMNWPQMGRYMYTARLSDIGEVKDFITVVHERKR